ncbi:MAG: DUF5615 family PIN-like protein [Dehalococcoidia bacterium]
MSLPLYFDQHAPLPVALGLRRRGLTVHTAEADGRKNLDDEALLEHATTLGCVFVTNDRDFLAITARWLQDGRQFSGLAYYSDQNTPYRSLLDDLTLIATACTAEEMIDRIEYLPL